MKIVIDIPKEYYEILKEMSDETLSMDMAIIKYGTPLPEHHGRLIDADRVIAEMNDMKVGGEVFTTAVNYVKLTMKDAPTIIERSESE